MDPSYSDRPHSISIENRAHNDRWELAAQTSSDLVDWWSGLEQHLLDQGDIYLFVIRHCGEPSVIYWSTVNASVLCLGQSAILQLSTAVITVN